MSLAKRFSVKAAMLAAVTACVLSACSHSEVAVDETHTFVLSDTMLRRIEISEVKNEPVKSRLRLVGKIIADENKLVEVYPLLGGNVSEVNVELGDYVRKGQVLAVIRSGEVADYDRELIGAQNDLLVAQKNLRVAEDLFESKLASEKDVLAARNEVNKTQAELARLKEIFSIYGIDKKSEYQVRAPISGFIIEKRINRDMQLRSDKSDNIFTVAEINDVWVSANVYESDIARIKPKMEAEVRILSYPDSVFYGNIDKIYNILDPQTRTMKVRIKLNNLGYLLKPEMNATIGLVYHEGISLPAIPSSALIFDRSKTYVMVFRDRYNMETREVEVYRQGAGLAYISKGLSEGEKVISKEQLLIYDALND